MYERSKSILKSGLKLGLTFFQSGPNILSSSVYTTSTSLSCNAFTTSYNAFGSSVSSWSNNPTISPSAISSAALVFPAIPRFLSRTL